MLNVNLKTFYLDLLRASGYFHSRFWTSNLLARLQCSLSHLEWHSNVIKTFLEIEEFGVV